jgi:hypothetical protein
MARDVVLSVRNLSVDFKTDDGTLRGTGRMGTPFAGASCRQKGDVPE